MTDQLTSIPTPLYHHAKWLLGAIKYPGLEFQTFQDTNDQTFIRVHCPHGCDAETGENWAWNGRWWRLSTHMTDSEIVGTAFKAVLTALEHEARESFKFEGAAVYGPHLDIHALKALAQDRSQLDVRG